jgi:hypothetical protein
MVKILKGKMTGTQRMTPFIIDISLTQGERKRLEMFLEESKEIHAK